MLRTTCLLAALTALSLPATAGAAENHELQFGVNLRTDRGVHFARLDAGWHRGRLGLLLVVDPMFWTDGQTFTDLIGYYMGDVFQPFAGWRLTTIPLLDGPQFQQNLLLGLGLPFPRFFDGKLGGQWGFELAMMVLKHGGGLPSESIKFTSGRYYIDFVQFGMYARFDYNVELP